MKALLISMPNSSFQFHNSTVVPNIGLMSIASNCDEKHRVEVADLVIVRRNFKAFLRKYISENDPDVIGLSAMSFQSKVAKYIANFVKEIKPSLITVIGGYHATMQFEEMALDKKWKKCIDFIIRGEGEDTFNELLNALESDKNFQNIKGLSFNKDTSFVHNDPRPLQDLAKIKPPDRSVRVLTKGFHMYGRPFDILETSRGCLLACKFCSIMVMYQGSNFRKYSLERILDDIQNSIENGAKIIALADDNIMLDAHHVIQLCNGIIERGLNKKTHFFVQASVHGLYSPKGYKRNYLMNKLIQANFKIIFLGIENPSQKNLLLYGKKFKKMTQWAETVVSYLKQHGTVVYANFIVGNPEDKKEDFYAVLDYAKRIKLDLISFAVLTPFPKTPLRELLKKENLIWNEHDFTSYDIFTANVRTKYLGRRQVENLTMKLWNSYYDLNWIKHTNFLRYYYKYVPKMIINQFPLFMVHLKGIFFRKNEIDILKGSLAFEKEYRDLKR